MILFNNFVNQNSFIRVFFQFSLMQYKKAKDWQKKIKYETKQYGRRLNEKWDLYTLYKNCSMLSGLMCIKFFVNILKSSMQVFVLMNKLSTHGHIFSFEEIIKLSLKSFHNPFNTVFNFLTSFFICLLNLFL